MKTNYFYFILLLSLVSTMSYSQQTIFFDFGPTGTPTSGNYNNASGVSPTATPIANLINSTGASTGFGYDLNDDFIDRNTTGSTAPTGSAAIFDVEATRDSFFGSSNHGGKDNQSGGFLLTGLDNTKYYSFEVFSSRAGVTDVREALYTVVGSNTVTGSLNASNNDTNTVLINNVQPTSGTITFTATPGAGNTSGVKYFYMGAIKMEETSTALSTESFIAENGGLFVYPNPVENVLNISYTLNNSSKTSIAIYDITGKLVFNKDNGINQAGSYNFKWGRTDNNGANIAAGVYIFQMRTETNKISKRIVLK